MKIKMRTIIFYNKHKLIFIFLKSIFNNYVNFNKIKYWNHYTLTIAYVIVIYSVKQMYSDNQVFVQWQVCILCLHIFDFWNTFYCRCTIYVLNFKYLLILFLFFYLTLLSMMRKQSFAKSIKEKIIKATMESHYLMYWHFNACLFSKQILLKNDFCS